MQQHKQLGLCSLVASLLPVICWSLPSSIRGKRSTLLEDHQRYYAYKHLPRGITSLLYPSNMNTAVDDDVILGEPDVISMLAKRSARSRLMRNFRSGRYLSYLSISLSVYLSICSGGSKGCSPLPYGPKIS